MFSCFLNLFSKCKQEPLKDHQIKYIFSLLNHVNYLKKIHDNFN